MENTESTIFTAVGRRKTSIARIRLSDGKGTIIINKKEYNNYFDRKVHEMDILKPLELTDSRNKYDIAISVTGGGKTGQSGAIRHGISRALLLVDPSNRGTLKRNGFLTRDSRMVERKKYGQKGARKSFQFSKR